VQPPPSPLGRVVALGVTDGEDVALGVGVAVGTGVSVGVGVPVALGVGDGVGVGVAVGVSVGVGGPDEPYSKAPMEQFTKPTPGRT